MTGLAQHAVAGVVVGTQATLILLHRSTGVEKARYPIDGQTCTIGQRPEDDIRLYYPEVSNQHARIQIAPSAGPVALDDAQQQEDDTQPSATLSVMGRNGVFLNGVLHVPRQSSTQDAADALILPLKDGDIIEIRRKPWKFLFTKESDAVHGLSDIQIDVCAQFASL